MTSGSLERVLGDESCGDTEHGAFVVFLMFVVLLCQKYSLKIAKQQPQCWGSELMDTFKLWHRKKILRFRKNHR